MEVSLLYVHLNMFDVHIFIHTGLVSTDPELYVISSRLWQILTEPVGSVAALLSTSQTAQAVPYSIIYDVRGSAIRITEVIISNERREIRESGIDRHHMDRNWESMLLPESRCAVEDFRE